MSRKERGERANRVTGRDAGSSSAGVAAGAGVPGPGRTATTGARKIPTTAQASLEVLAQRDDGWLRLVPSRDGSPIYLKWKFTSGPRERYYVMTVAQYWQLDYAFVMLLHKLSNFDAGDYSDCAKDTLYQNMRDEAPNA